MEIPKANAINPVWKLPTIGWAVIFFIGALLTFIFYAGIKFLLRQWEAPEYGYAYLIPAITLFLIWQKKNLLQSTPFVGSWLGLIIAAVGVVLFFLGELSALHIIIQYALLVVIFGLVLAFAGVQGFRIIWVPLLLLVFMIPLPGFIYQGLSENLQLLSSSIGVAVIRLFGISVFLEGNVIDLGTYKLQVVEACSGLRYLFPLMTLGFIAAYFFKVSFWKRAVIFLSTIPITVLMNSFRIGMIGVLVDHWGQGMAEGFLHYFEGWVIFMASTGVMVAEMWLLTKLSKDTRPLQEVFGLDWPAPAPKDAAVNYRSIPKPFVVASVMLVAAGIVTASLPHRTEAHLVRKDFSEFPMTLGEWHGKQQRLEQIYVDALNFDDYIMSDFIDNDRHLVNLYVGYYASQRADKVPHSPRACIPGGGWEISSLTQRDVKGVTVDGVPLRVNRLVIARGDNRQLVYYWFQQRGRVVTSEYLVKWYLFWDALKKNRTDGALVRFVTPVEPGHDIAEADERLASFAKLVAPQLATYIPE